MQKILLSPLAERGHIGICNTASLNRARHKLTATLMNWKKQKFADDIGAVISIESRALFGGACHSPESRR